jgi:hypothetical protein
LILKVLLIGCLVKGDKHSLDIQGMFADAPPVMGYADPPAMDAEKEGKGAWSNKMDGWMTGSIPGT